MKYRELTGQKVIYNKLSYIDAILLDQVSSINFQGSKEEGTYAYFPGKVNFELLILVNCRRWRLIPHRVLSEGLGTKDYSKLYRFSFYFFIGQSHDISNTK